MKIVLIAIILFLKQGRKVEYPALSELRRLYHVAAIQQDSSKKLSMLLTHLDSGSQPVYICYKGVSKMMQAKYAINPMVKLSLFNNGKTLMENAISTDTTDMEMRYLRLSIQKNLPLMLGYNRSILSDKMFLQNNINNENDNELKELILSYLSSLK